jgi:predicted adenylyl cyclase CyaB
MKKRHPQEIEVKFRVNELRSFKKKLKGLGAILLWKGTEENFYLENGDNRLKANHQVLRVRKWRGCGDSLTFKSNVDGIEDGKYKIRTELQIDISDAYTALEILGRLGFKPILEYKKRRAHYRLGGAYIELDNFDGQFFLEIEGRQKEIDHLVEKLKLSWKNRESRSYVELVKEKQKV